MKYQLWPAEELEFEKGCIYDETEQLKDEGFKFLILRRRVFYLRTIDACATGKAGSVNNQGESTYECQRCRVKELLYSGGQKMPWYRMLKTQGREYTEQIRVAACRPVATGTASSEQ